VVLGYFSVEFRVRRVFANFWVVVFELYFYFTCREAFPLIYQMATGVRR
jgi:hypothetical protein